MTGKLEAALGAMRSAEILRRINFKPEDTMERLAQQVQARTLPEQRGVYLATTCPAAVGGLIALSRQATRR